MMETNFKGVRKTLCQRFTADIRDPFKKTKDQLDTFDTTKEPVQAYDDAARYINLFEKLRGE